MSVRACVVAAALAAAVVSVPATSRANGRPPQSIKLEFRPGNTSDMLLGVTFGLLVSHDDAATWQWICESAVGFQGTFDPDYEYSPSGAIFATTFDGLRFTRDGCAWQAVPAPLGSWLVTSVTIGPDGTIYAGAADPVLGSGVFKSTDDGVSFQPTGNLNQVFDWFDTIEVAPSDPQRLYVTGYRLAAGQPRTKLLFRSLDAGATWESLPITDFVGTDMSDVQIAAVDPDDPDVVYAKLTFITRAGINEAIYRTANWSRPLAMGGPTWTRVIALNGFINGVVVRDNEEVWITTATVGTHRSTDGGNTFTPVPGISYEGRCLAERPGDQSLWLCANNLPPDLMALGRSTSGDAGTWEVKLRYADIAGPVSCQPGNDQHDDCEVNLWCGLKDQFGATTNAVDCTDAGEVITPPGDPEPKPCCGAGGGPPGLEVGVGALAVALLLRRRQTKKDASREASERR